MATGKRTAVIAVLLVSLLVSAWGGYTVYSHAKSIRELPVQTPFVEAVTSIEPLGLAYRVMLMKPGSDRYHRAIIPWLFNNAELSDNAMNRGLLEKLLLAADPDFVGAHLHRYPLAATPRLTTIFEHLLDRAAAFDGVEAYSDEWYEGREPRRASRSALMRLGDYAEGRQIINRWIDERILATHNADNFRYYFGTLAAIQSVDLQSLLAAFDKELGALPGSDDHLRLNWYDLQTDSPHIDVLFAWALEKLESGEVELDVINVLLTKSVCADATKASALDWFLGLSNEEKITAFDAMFGGYDDWGPKLSEHGVDLHESSYDYSELPACVPEELLEQAWTAMQDEAARQLALLHAQLHHEHPGAVSRVNLAIGGDDSALRKGAIVLLARHQNAGVRYDIDDAFRGEAPRLVLFREEEQYRSSVALQRYEALSGHDYGHVGKRFPPSFGSGAYADNDAAEWRAFIDDFPWYVSTDDAYFRYAYEHFLDGDLPAARSVIAEYRSRTYIDADASPYMDQLEALINLVSRPRHRVIGRAPLDDILIAAWMRDPDSVAQAVESAVLIVDLLYVFETAAAAAGVTEADLVAARKALDLERTKCSSRRRECAIPDAYRSIDRKLSRAPTNNAIVYLTSRIRP
jgi:hypothetical protein